MITSHLFEISAMIKAGLDAKRTPEEAPRPAAPDVVGHVVEFTAIAAANEAKAEAAEATPCPWVCPSTCRNCLIESCQDRLAGTPDVD